MPIEQSLIKIIKEGAQKASLALSKLTGEQASIEFSKIEVGKIQNVFLKFDPELIVSGIYLPITGDIIGASILIFPEKIAYNLCDLLVGRKPGTTRQLTEHDKSALKELGNIILGSLLTVLSNNLKMKIIEHLPEFCFDMLGAVIDQITAQFIQKAEEVLIIELAFNFKDTAVKGYVFLFSETEGMEVLIKNL